MPPIVKKIELHRSNSDPLSSYPTDSRGAPRKRKSLSRLVDPNFFALKDNPAYKSSSLEQRKFTRLDGMPLLRRNGSNPLQHKRRQSHNSALRFRENGSDGSPPLQLVPSPLVTGRRASHFSPRSSASATRRRADKSKDFSRAKGSIHYSDLFKPKGRPSRSRSLSDAAGNEPSRLSSSNTLAPETALELDELNQKVQLGERKIIKLRQWNKEIEVEHQKVQDLEKERTGLKDVIKNLRAQVSQLEGQIHLMKEKEEIFQNQILRLSTMMMQAQTAAANAALEEAAKS